MSRWWSRWLVAVLVAAVGLGSTACSDDDHGDPPPTTETTGTSDTTEPPIVYPPPTEDRSGEVEDGSVLFHGMRDGERGLWRVDTRGETETPVAVDGYEGIGGAVVAPDGRTVAALAWGSDRVERASALVVGEPDELTPLVDDPNLDLWCVRWFPSGERLLVTAFVEEDLDPRLFAVDLDGTVTEVDIPDGRFECAVPIGDDQAVVAYLGMDIQLMGLAILDLDGGDREFLYERPGCLLFGGALSPDRTRVLVAADCEETEENGLVTVELDSGDAELVLAVVGSYPAWSPSGEWITFGVYETPSALDSTVWAVRADGTGLRQLSDRPGIQPAWVAPSGS